MGNRLSKIVTKTGDKGMTSFGGGCSLISKGHPAIELIGAIDELNAHIGLVKSNLKGSMYSDLGIIQQTLFDMGAEVFMNKPDRVYVTAKDVECLETLIEFMNEKLPPLKDFILPGANKISAFVHVARTVCRRAELIAWRYLESQATRETPPQYVRFLNRLSDFLFVLARHETKPSEETQWTGGGKK